MDQRRQRIVRKNEIQQGIKMFEFLYSNFWQIVSFGIFIAACAHISFGRGYTVGTTQAIEATLNMLEAEKLITLEEDGGEVVIRSTGDGRQKTL